MTSSTDSLTATGPPVGTWIVDPDRSTISFAIRQFTAKVRGQFHSFDATIVTAPNPSDATVSATIDLASIDTTNAKRDAHLSGPRVLTVDERPTMTYRSIALRENGSGWLLEGELSLNGFTVAVPLAVTTGDVRRTSGGGREATFTATTTISRRAFGLRLPGDLGGTLVSDSVAITLAVTAVLQGGAP